MPRPPIHRRKFLVDPELQIGLSTEMVGWIYVYFVGCSLVTNLPSLIDIATTPPDEAAYLAAMDHLRGFARYVVLPMGVTFVAMAVHGILVTHRIAGPIVRLKRTMRELAARRLPGPITLRKKDHFKDLVDEINAAVAVLREDSARRTRMAEDTVERLRKLCADLENRGAEAREQLAQAHEALDAAESLARHLATTTDASQPVVPLPEKELPAVVAEQIDELDPEVVPSGGAHR